MADSINAEKMAEAMEVAFDAEWRNTMGDADPPGTNPQMHLMFLAIAEGVVNHLKANPEAFKVTVTQTGSGSNYTGNVTEID